MDQPTPDPEALARDESYWDAVRCEYVRPDDFIHLEYGWYHPSAKRVLAAEIAALQMGQRRASHYKRGEMNADREAARADLARLAGATSDELIVTRNTTEAMNIVLQGMPLSRGDGIVFGDQDYPSVVEALQQRAARDGLELQCASVPLLPGSDEEVVARFEAAIAPNSRALVITHLINHTGQVLPVQALCALGRQHGLQVVVDAAHSFAQIDFSVGDLDCDYLAASLHKWLGAPLGTGLLYVRRERIEGVTPLFADTRRPATDIRKLEHFGNSPDSAHLGLREAIRWHEVLGTRLKGARLRYLQRRWSDVARSLPGIRVLTPEAPSRHGALGTFAVEGRDPDEIVATLMDSHSIFVNAVHHPVVEGVRVTPGVPSSPEDIDRLVEALRALAHR
jgi:selenocysteine lyase/cysteine desulfurase